MDFRNAREYNISFREAFFDKFRVDSRINGAIMKGHTRHAATITHAKGPPHWRAAECENSKKGGRV